MIRERARCEHGDRQKAFGILDVNGWHNVVHLLIGIAAIVAGLATPAHEPSTTLKGSDPLRVSP
jgi:hypothetical protein